MNTKLASYFDRVVVVNLDRRPDRMRAFEQALGEIDWPFRPPERLAAVDGDAVTVPIWWKQGGGAWGCMMSHARILEDCIREGVERALVLEDDATFVKGFASRVAEFLDAVPEDWDQLYLGGQHLKDPQVWNPQVYRCVNVNRTHCYGVSRRFMSRMYRYVLNAHDYLAYPGHHVDHRLGALHESGTVKVYAPVTWLVGQREEQSDISGRSNPTYFWNTWADVPSMTMTVVLGLHLGGANQVAGLMRELGVHFGHRLGGYQEPQVEDEGLAGICERTFPFPATTRWLEPDQTAPLLYDWCALILQEAANFGTVGAACYPHLCAMYPDMAQAWKNLKVIHVDQDVEAAVEALVRRSEGEEGWLRVSAEEASTVQRFLNQQHRQWLDHCEHLHIRLDDLARDREAVGRRIAAFIGLDGAADGASTRVTGT